MFKVLQRVIQVLHFLFCNPLDCFAPWSRNMAQVNLLSSAHYANGFFILLSVQVTHTSAPIRTWACINVSRTSDSKHYIRWSFWDECRHISHCPTNWWTFLLHWWWRHRKSNLHFFKSNVEKCKVTQSTNMWSHCSLVGGTLRVGIECRLRNVNLMRYQIGVRIPYRCRKKNCQKLFVAVSYYVTCA